MFFCFSIQKNSRFLSFHLWSIFSKMVERQVEIINKNSRSWKVLEACAQFFFVYKFLGMMDLSKAMNILGLPTLQKFENTSEDEISKVFLLRIRVIMKNRNHSKGNQKDKRERYTYQIHITNKAIISYWTV